MSRMLMFESTVDYEMPCGQAMSDTNTNTYMVTVKAEAGGEIEMVEVTVMVTNEEEVGTVSLSPESTVAGSPVTASRTDPDGDITDLTWTWETSSDMATWSAATGAVVSEGTASTYTSVEDDADDYLRATASYTDRYDSSNSESGVYGRGSSRGRQRCLPHSPVRPATRTIAENTAANTNIGDLVAATDPNGDTLTYSLGRAGRGFVLCRFRAQGQLQYLGGPGLRGPRVPTASKSRPPIRMGSPTPLT